MSVLRREIHPSLPTFQSNDPSSTKPVDFRRLLLNKCQQEFEDGVAAMKKVKEREEHDKEEAEKQGKEKATGAPAAADNGKVRTAACRRRMAFGSRYSVYFLRGHNTGYRCRGDDCLVSWVRLGRM